MEFGGIRNDTALDYLYKSQERINALGDINNVSYSNDISSTMLPSLDNSTATEGGTVHTGLLIGNHSLAEVILIGLVAVLLMTLTIGGNLLVILAYRKNRRLRSINNLFLVSLACSDLVIGIVSMTLYPIYIITQTWYLGEVACDIWLCIDYTLSMASVANLMLICLDRYFSVTRPFTYRRKRTRTKAKIAIVSAWIFSMLLWSPAILIWPRVRPRTVPPNECSIQFFEDPLITSITAILAFYLPVIVMIVLYWRIYMETKRCHQYLEYLRSYKITQAGARSPAVKRKPSITVQTSAVRSISNQLLSPRRRINSTPTDAYRSIRGQSWRACPAESKTITVFGRNSDITRNGQRPEAITLEIPQTKERGNPQNEMGSLQSVDNNNCVKAEQSHISQFQRFKLSITNSLWRSEHSHKLENIRPRDGYDSAETKFSCEDRSQDLDRSSFELDKNETGTLLANGKHPGCLENGRSRRKEEIINVNRSGTNSKPFHVPIIVTSHENNEPEEQVPLIVRRTMSCSVTETNTLNVPELNPAVTSSEPAGSPPLSVKVPSSERKAARTLSAILVAFIVTWLPYNVCVVYTSFCTVNHCQFEVPKSVWEMAYYLCYINSTVNPFCFALCNKTFRETFKRILSRSRPSLVSKPWCWTRRKRSSDICTFPHSTSSSRSATASPLKRRDSLST